ncbi:Serine/threonine protein kinase [Colletotrichum higginsianum IMI 349063]|uniref:Serine/threonine protein kinase n=3 Tax=Colletotrichum higginsianum TaxID=80884 RepID=A0A1B7YEX8_COLHI|nr:Serine/threonine protein kinase [Colletotrichum higginsianum IMI 349063]OBR10480.1 Serine/threonine protein kinase [Colletotrichum higginsianum IMI 349063]TID06518.1 Calcium/calmodulin-dependent protein kinase [Colletotrichum higginsianum]GJD02502.1 serine/threonine protein kinase [Colletotrichum higginsianum]
MPLFDTLDASLVDSPFRGPKFVPLSSLKTIITKASVEQELSSITRLRNPQLSRNVVQNARKVFSILVFIDKASAIKELYRDGLTDDQLPLSSRKDDAGRITPFTHHGKKTFASFGSWKTVSIKSFLDKQWLLLSPVFDKTGRHFDLNPACALPMFPDTREVATGPYNAVHQGWIHPAHQRVSKNCGEHGLKVALKEFRGEYNSAKSNFEKEWENLSHIQQHNHPHLIKHIATWQAGNKFFVMFEWADGGSLWDFWERENPGAPSQEVILWSLRQIRGLVSALEALHSLNCRHGDLKPENILHFKDRGDKHESSGGRGILVMADVGVSRVHKQMTHLRIGPTTTRATTISYQAPETDTDPKVARSRAYDAWSIGCILLEHIVWLLYGLQGIEGFRKRRESKSFDGTYGSANFYSLTISHLERRAEIHHAVEDAMDALQRDPRCQVGTALGDLLKLIREGLLKIDPQDRFKALEIQDAVERIVRDARPDSLYLLNTSNRPSPVPSIFRYVYVSPPVS